MAKAFARSPGRPFWRGEFGLFSALAVFAFAAWIVIGDRMAGMDAGPGTALGSFGFYVMAWIVMMAAMMFPSIAPMVLTYGMIQRRRRGIGRQVSAVSTPAFVAGYLVVWMLFGVAAYAMVELLSIRSNDPLGWDRGGRYASGALIVLAAAYQLTPAKNACLSRCRGPLTFLMERWRDGPIGALRLGIVHGAWCVGCCWGLMVCLFALGAMSLTWMVFIAVLIAGEKLLPWRVAANRGIAVVLVVLGVAVVVAPDQVPGLTTPAGSGMLSATHLGR